MKIYLSTKGVRKKLRLPDVEAWLAEAFVAWAYDPKTPIFIAMHSGNMVSKVLKACKFGIRIDCPLFCNAMLDLLVDASSDDDQPIPSNEAKKAYAPTEPASNLRSAIVELFVAKGGFSGPNAHRIDEAPPQFREDGLIAEENRKIY